MTHGSRSYVSWRAPRTPADFRHHALVRDADVSVFDLVVRRLRQRLYRGRATTTAGQEFGFRCAILRQGAPVWLSPAVLFTGVAVISVVGSELAAWMRFGMSLVWVGGAAIACTPRKHVWVVAQPAATEGRIDLWLAGAGVGAGGRFAAEFAHLVSDTAALCMARGGVAVTGANAGHTSATDGAPRHAQQI
jgi:hypothetical protein